MSATHRPALDVVRGVAILTVLLFHFHQLTPRGVALNGWVDRLLANGWAGVDLFFVLSGFLITGILLDARGEGPACPDGYFRSFYIRRAVRIFPLYYAALVLVAVTGLVPLLAPLWWHAAYLTNALVMTRGWGAAGELGHFWSLAIEEQFYLVWPLVVALTPRRHLWKVCVGAVGAGMLGRLGIFAATAMIGRANAGHVVAHVFTGVRIDALALGGLAALVERTPALHGRWHAVRPLATLTAIAALAGVVILKGSVAWSTTLAGQLLGFLALAWLSVVAVERAAAWRAPLQGMGRSLAWLGTYSYGIYVLHHLVRTPYRAVWVRVLGAASLETWWGPWAFIAGGAAVSVAGALVSWYLWEVRWLSLKRFAPMPRPARCRPGEATAVG